jgi:HSP20 family molecular chaperone IbpA
VRPIHSPIFDAKSAAYSRSRSELGRPWPTGESLFVPQVDVGEADKEILVSAELPGLESKDVELSVEKDLLTIRGEKRSEETSGEGGQRWTERTYGKFERNIPTDRREGGCLQGGI